MIFSSCVDKMDPSLLEFSRDTCTLAAWPERSQLFAKKTGQYGFSALTASPKPKS